jgi:hypothetical protein
VCVWRVGDPRKKVTGLKCLMRDKTSKRGAVL